MNDKSKLKMASVIQSLASLGAGLGAGIPALQQWGENEQQLTSNYARALEQKIAEKEAKKRKKSGLFGALGGLLGAVTGGALGPIGGILGGMLGSTAGQAIGGGRVNDYQQIASSGIQGLGMGAGAKQYQTYNASGSPMPLSYGQKIGNVGKYIAGVEPPKPMAIVEIGGETFVMNPTDAAWLNLTKQMYNLNNNKKKDTNSGRNWANAG